MLEVLFYCGINKFEDFSLQGGNSGCEEIARLEFLSTIRWIDEVEDHGPKVRTFLYIRESLLGLGVSVFV